MKTSSSSSGGVARGVFTVASFTSLSRVLGMVREILQSRLVGAGVEQSAFTLAFALPNLARKLFGEGALTAAFVPVFKAEVESGDMESARKLARAVLTMSVLMLSSLVVLALAAIGVFAGVEPGGLSARAGLTVGLVRTLLPYMVFICGAAFGMGVLNALGRFKASGAMPCLLNVFWIAALATVSFFPQWSLQMRVRVVAWAILCAGAAQFAFMLWRMHAAGISPRLSFAGWRSEKVRKVWRNTAVAAVGAGAVQINCMLDQFLAQLASPWAAGVIGYAERLMDLPLGVIAVSFGTVLLPAFSGSFARGDITAAKKTFSDSVGNMMFLMIPAAAGMAVLAPEITSVIYEGSAFDAMASLRVSRALAIYALGLAFFGYQKAVVPWFQAQNDMKTPLSVSVKMVFLNAALNILSVFLLPVEWRHAGLAGSTVVSSAAGGGILTLIAVRRHGGLGLSEAIPCILRTIAAAVAMAVALLSLKPMMQATGVLTVLAAEIVAGGVVFTVTAYILGERKFLIRLRRRNIKAVDKP